MKNAHSSDAIERNRSLYLGPNAFGHSQATVRQRCYVRIQLHLREELPHDEPDRYQRSPDDQCGETYDAAREPVCRDTLGELSFTENFFFSIHVNFLAVLGRRTHSLRFDDPYHV